MSILGTYVNRWVERIVRVGGDVPIENGLAEGTGATRPAEEQVPNGVTEGRRLGGGAEAGGTGRTAEGEGDDFALSLTSLDLRSEELAVRQRSAWEVRIVRRVAGLLYRSVLLTSGITTHFAVDGQLTLAMFKEGRPPAPLKTFTNAKGMTSIESSWSWASQTPYSYKCDSQIPRNNTRDPFASWRCRNHGWRRTSFVRSNCKIT